MRNIFGNGLKTGFLLQMAIGPVFVYIVNTTMQNRILNAVAALVGVTLADYLYITLALLGVGKLLEQEKIKRVFTIISSAVLILFGLMLIQKGCHFMADLRSCELSNASPFGSFGSAFALTAASPLTIVFWTSIFAAKTVEYSLNHQELVVFGVAAGLTTVIFLGSAIVIFSLVKTVIPLMGIKILNILVGTIIIGYGIKRIFQSR